LSLSRRHAQPPRISTLSLHDALPIYKRLALHGEVRLRNAYVIRCNEAIKNEAGEIVELRCTYDPATLGANPEGRKVKGVIHWVRSEEHTSELQSRENLVCRLLLEKKK